MKNSFCFNHLGSVRAVVYNQINASPPTPPDVDGMSHSGASPSNYTTIVVQTTDYYPSGMIMKQYGAEEQPFKFAGNEFDTTHGLGMYDVSARYFDPILMRWHVPNPLAEKYPWISPYAYCSNNPVNFIDPDGMDWFTDYDGTYQYDPELTKENQSERLQEGQAYVGITHKVLDKNGKVIENYRKDGSIIFKNETSAYNRMWKEATKPNKGVEESGYALENGKFIVIPDYKNEADDATPTKYGYTIKDGMLSTDEGETFNIVGNVHTHQDPSGNPGPSFWTHKGWGDVGHSKAMGGLPIITIGHDGKVHGAFWSVIGNGFRSIHGFGSRQDLLSGKTKLVPWLKTFPTRGQ